MAISLFGIIGSIGKVFYERDYFKEPVVTYHLETDAKILIRSLIDRCQKKRISGCCR